jgi:Asp-tRNA(Asn)/Glu-tRNA(Gln) amidotransferase A subunit family amidase
LIDSDPSVTGKVRPFELTAVEATAALARGDLSVRELVDSCLDRIDELEPTIGAWVSIDHDFARSRADQLDKRKIKHAENLGPLFGLPIGVKDVFNTTRFPTAMGSPIFSGFTPGNDARVVSNLELSDAVIMGKTVTAEFAIHYPGKTVNPQDVERSPGTSSSGSAAAIACQMVPLALGTQTAGSTIRPASFVGVYGYKPTFGLVPRTGILKTLDTLDHVTFFARCSEDLRLVMDSTRVRGQNYPFVNKLLESDLRENSRKRWRVGFIRTHVWDLAEDYVQRAMISFVKRLATEDWIELEEISLPPGLETSHDVHDLIYTKSISYYFQDEYRGRKSELSDIMVEMIEKGMEIPTDRFHWGLRRQNELGNQLDEMLSSYDVVLSHSTAHVAPKGLHTVEQRDPCLMWTLCRVPAINVPIFTGPQGLPFGLQAISRRYRDYSLLAFVDRLRREGLAATAPYPPVSIVPKGEEETSWK